MNWKKPQTFYKLRYGPSRITAKAKALLRETNLVIAKRLLQKPTNLKKQSLAAVALSGGLEQAINWTERRFTTKIILLSFWLWL